MRYACLMFVLIGGLITSSCQKSKDFRKMKKPHVVFMVGEINHYGSRETMPALAKELEEKHHCKVTYIDNELKLSSEGSQAKVPSELYQVKATKRRILRGSYQAKVLKR